MIKPAENIRRPKTDAHTWVWNNIEEIVDKYAGGFIIVVDDHIVFTDADGSPRDLMKRTKRKYPKSKILFFRVPHPRDFLCALIML